MKKYHAPDGPPMIYESTLLKRSGWTLAAVKEFAGEPDKLVPNRHYKSGPECRLYLLERIIQIEKSADFEFWREKADTRKRRAKASSKQAVETKRQRMLEWARTINIEVALRPFKNVEDAAILHHAMHRMDRNQEGIDYVHASREFLDRIMVNYLRHQASHYHYLLDQAFGKVGTTEAYAIIKGRVLDQIGKAYESLMPECERQKKCVG